MRRHRSLSAALAAAALLAIASPAAAAETVSGLSAAQVMEIAGKAEAGGDLAAAKAAYDALANDADVDVRSEARFRHARLLAAARDHAGAATLYRKILDERPDAARVRLELASVLYSMDDMRAAARELRQAQAGGLPADVALVVDQFAGALRARKPWGGSFSIGLAPDSNINRATKSDTLDTVIAPLDLSEDAQQTSGVGLRMAGQTYARLPIGDRLTLLPRFSSQAELYRQSQFNDVSASLQLGLELALPAGRVQPAFGATWRRYGKSLYARTQTASVNWVQGAGRRAQFDSNLSVSRADYVRNPLQDGWLYDLGTSYERALDSRSGGSVSLSLNRQSARDPGYSTLAGGLDLLYWRELGAMTVYGTAGIRRLEADKRLLLFPDRRQEWLLRGGLGATFRQAAVAGFAPVVRANYERNRSTVGLYDYGRTSLEFGITRAF